MLERLDLSARVTRAGIWLAAAFVYWWLRPTPLTQVSLGGTALPPIPNEWVFAPTDGLVERLYLIPFGVTALIFFWFGGPRSRGPSLAVTVFLATMALATALLGTFPLRHDWIIVPIQALLDPNRATALTDNVAMLFSLGGLMLTFLGVSAAFRMRMRDPAWRDQSKSRYHWPTMLHGWYGGHPSKPRHRHDSRASGGAHGGGVDGGFDGGGGVD